MAAQIVISATDPRPIYQQVADGIRQLIARGDLVEGTPLPPVRQIAADLDVNLNTVAAAYRELRKDGLIKVKHGSGSIVVSHNTKEKSPEDLLPALRVALTNLVLAGLPPEKIARLVQRELSVVSKGAK
jgi:GntR family transcriptional regulator